MMKFSYTGVIALIAASVFVSGAVAQQPAKVSPQIVDAYVKNTWKSPADGWQTRVDQDETQRICSETRNNPSKAEYAKIQARELATVVFPADGRVLGDW